MELKKGSMESPKVVNIFASQEKSLTSLPAADKLNMTTFCFSARHTVPIIIGMPKC